MTYYGVRSTAAIFAACVSLTIGATPSVAASCDVTAAKKQTIVSFLCGNMSAKVSARFSGDGCAAKSAQRRFTDDAALVHMAQVCGDKPFADRLQAFMVKTAKFAGTLSVCTSEQVNYSKLMDDALAQAVTKGVPCSNSMRELIKMKRADFEKSPASADPDKLVSAFFDKLSISVDGAGNLRDKK